MNDVKKSEETAIYRHKILGPLLVALEDGTDSARIGQMKHEICQQSGISWKTLTRWINNYKQRGFEGLKSMPGNREPYRIPESLIEDAIYLRRELPSRSVPQIIEILESEGKVKAGFLKRTTLQDRLSDRGYSAAQMKMYRQQGLATRRFARAERNDMWQSDIKYGPFIKVNGDKRQIYLVCFIDDATRYVVHAEFYDSQDQSVVEDCFRKAILKEGLPRRVFFDQGKQFNNIWMRRACAILGIRLLFARPYSPESKGKIERFNRSVDSFLDEVSLKRCQTLDEYNKYFKIWLQECYQSHEHSGLKTSPEQAYRSSTAALRFTTAEKIASAFRRVERRKVDKSGCISFRGKKYEVGVLFIGRTISISYDPNDPETLDAEPEHGEIFRINKLTIGPNTGPRPKLPKTLGKIKPETSRLLDAKEKLYDSRMDAARHAIRFGEFKDGGAGV